MLQNLKQAGAELGKKAYSRSQLCLSKISQNLISISSITSLKLLHWEMDRVFMDKCSIEKCHWATCLQSRMVPQIWNDLYSIFPGGGLEINAISVQLNWSRDWAFQNLDHLQLLLSLAHLSPSKFCTIYK